MTTITLDVPDDLAVRLDPLRDRLTDLISQALELMPEGRQANGASAPGSYPVFDEMIDFLAGGPTPQQIIEHKASPTVQARLEELLDKNREEGLTEAETAEMNTFRQVNHMMILLKARARRALQSSF
ncbi:MAG: hypothetical protein L0Y75_02780 [Acidobacteria bacterium]|nr:hypothetical protein [Acidobacteriota bacterium]